MDDSNSNRNARFDSYLIRTQTADSQIPTSSLRKDSLFTKIKPHSQVVPTITCLLVVADTYG